MNAIWPKNVTGFFVKICKDSQNGKRRPDSSNPTQAKKLGACPECPWACAPIGMEVHHGDTKARRFCFCGVFLRDLRASVANDFRQSVVEGACPECPWACGPP